MTGLMRAVQCARAVDPAIAAGQAHAAPAVHACAAGQVLAAGSGKLAAPTFPCPSLWACPILMGKPWRLAASSLQRLRRLDRLCVHVCRPRRLETMCASHAQLVADLNSRLDGLKVCTCEGPCSILGVCTCVGFCSI